MSALKSLAFVAAPKLTMPDPTIDRRMKVISRLEEQKALLADPSFKRTVSLSVKKDGVRTTEERQQKISPWWRLTTQGSYVFCVRVGWKAIEFDKGKSGIVSVITLFHGLSCTLFDCLVCVRIGFPLRLRMPSCSRPSRTLRAAGAVARAGRGGRMAPIERKDCTGARTVRCRHLDVVDGAATS